MYFILKIASIIQGPDRIYIRMVSGCSEHVAKTYGGSYCYYEMQNERKVYKVSFVLTKLFQFAFKYFRRVKKVKMVPYIFGTILKEADGN